MSKCPWNNRSKCKETQGIKLAHLPYHFRNFAVFGTSRLAVQGDDDDESNFIQLRKLHSETFLEFTDWLSKKAEIYTSNDVPNVITNLMSNQIMRNLLDLFAVAFFGLCMMSTRTFVIKHSWLSVCVGWISFWKVPRILRKSRYKKQHHCNSYEGHISKISTNSWHVQRSMLWWC